MKSKSYTLAEISDKIGAKLVGDGECVIHGLSTIERGEPGKLTFLDNPRYQKYLKDTNAAAVILAPNLAEQWAGNALLSPNPYLSYAKAATLFSGEPQPKAGIHPSATIGEHCEIHPSATIGPSCVIGDNTIIGENSIIEAGCIIGQDCKIGQSCRLWSNVTVYYGVEIGDETIIHSNTVIGSDGFGNARDAAGWIKVPQLGGVKIGRRVEIGASTTIDRGAIEDTVIEDGVRLDNQIQVGHNVRIGENTAIAACTGISGSVTIGKNCLISGMVGFTGHFNVVDNVVITGMTVVSKPITKPGVYSSGTAIEPHDSWRKNAVRFRQLDRMHQRIAHLEKELQSTKDKEEQGQ